MDNYVKDCVLEVEDQSGLPFGDYCPSNVIHMKVKSGTKVKNIIDYSVKHFVDNSSERQIVISGSADASNKVISCTEVLKQCVQNQLRQHLYQLTKICYKTFEEFWKPKDKDLDVLKVVRRIPQIFILLSKDSLNPNESGFQYKDITIFNQLIDKNDLNSNSNQLKQNKSKPKKRQKNNRKSGNESNDNKKMETQS